MSYRRFARSVVDALPAGTFEVVVTGDSVTRGKPDPEPYLQAARLLGVPPRRCLAIEDTNTGARSAETAGAWVLVVPNHVPVLEGERRVFRDSLSGAGTRGTSADTRCPARRLRGCGDGHGWDGAAGIGQA